MFDLNTKEGSNQLINTEEKIAAVGPRECSNCVTFRSFTWGLAEMVAQGDIGQDEAFRQSAEHVGPACCRSLARVELPAQTPALAS